jgi:hypothetical protein
MLKKVWKHWTKSKNSESPRFRRDMAERIAGKHIKYVTERHGDDVEEVVGKDGGMMIRGDEFLVFASQNIIMRCHIDDMKAWELLSNDGVVITAPDIEHGGMERTIIVHYVYYR